MFDKALPPQPETTNPSGAAPSRGDATRQKLLAAAHKLFLQQGFHGTSMRQIAEEAGVAVGGIYNHFATKEDIFAAVLDAFHPYHVLVPALDEIEVMPTETMESFVRQAAHTVYAKTAGTETQVLSLIFMELLEFQGRHLRALAETIVPKFMVFVQRFMQLQGNLRKLPPPIMLRALMSLMIGFMMTELLLRNTKLVQQFNLSSEQWLDGLVTIYLHGILEEK
ncbi:MAG: TetR/AcrR family transcriptional regulator [Anaerolineales bacterium]|nr:TetR/AcrR family transcriptional regulator [Anaerolineales bacterium]